MKKLYYKFALYVTFLVVLMLASYGFIMWTNYRSLFLSEMRDKGNIIARLVAKNAVEPAMISNFSALQSIVAKVKNDRSSDVEYLLITDKNGNCTVTDSESTKFLRKKLDVGRAVKNLVLNKEKILEVIEPIESYGKVWGFVKIGFSLKRINNISASASKQILLITLAFLISGIILSLYLSRLVTQPIEDLVYSAEQIAKGKLNSRAQVRNKNEIGRLAMAFNSMVEKIENSHLYLEEKVKESTRGLRLANDQLKILNEKLKKASQTKSDFLANMSHELRTPLNAVIGFSEVMQDETFGSLNVKQKKYVSNVLTSARHLLSLINDILDLAKVEAGKMVLSFSDISLKKLMDEMNTIVKTLAFKKGIKLIFDVHDIQFQADEGRIKQVMYNLLSNALKFTPEGGEVRVKAWQDEQFVYITVSDNGMGIDRKDLDKIFEEFQQLENPFVREHEGTGLGLALTKKIVSLHGGKINIESKPGAGSVFTVVLPLKETPESTATIPFLNPPKKKTIVFLGFDPLKINEQPNDVLEDFNIEQHENFDMLKRRDSSEIPYVIAIDVMSMKNNALTCIAALRKDAYYRVVPLVLGGNYNGKLCALSRGVRDFFIRPYSEKDIVNSLSRNGLAPRILERELTALVVSDDINERNQIKSILEREEFLVKLVEDYNDGIVCIVEQEPQVVFLSLKIFVKNIFSILDTFADRIKNKELSIFILFEINPEEQMEIDFSDALSTIFQRPGFFKKSLEKVARDWWEDKDE